MKFLKCIIAIIEKHFTHDKTLPGNDHYHAMDKKDLKIFHHNLDRIFTLLGDQQKHPLKTEAPARKNARRSLVAQKNIPQGKVVEKDLEYIFKKKIRGTLSASQIMSEYDLNQDKVITKEEYISRSITTFKAAKTIRKGFGNS